MASSLAASVITTWSVYKMQKAGSNLIEIESAMEEKMKKCDQFSHRKQPAGKLLCKFHTTIKRREIESRIVE